MYTQVECTGEHSHFQVTMDSKVHCIRGKSDGTVKGEELKYYDPRMPVYGLTRVRGQMG